MELLLFSNRAVLYVAYLLVGVATFIIARMLLKEEETRAAEDNLEDARNRYSSNALVKITRPFFSQYVVPMVRGKNYWDTLRLKYKRKLISAGLNRELSPDEFISFKLFLIVFFPLVGGFMKSFDLLEFSGYWFVIIGVSGWFYPDFWIKKRIEDRQKQIRKAMPFIVDLLALSTEAGLDFIGAIGKVVEKAIPSPLVDEFEQLLKEIKVGSSRAEAMREMGNRIDMVEVSSFIAILISADQMGASIGKTLRQQSEQIRSERFVRAEKAGAVAAQKLLFPLVFIILPAVFLMIFGPFFLSSLNSGGGGI